MSKMIVGTTYSLIKTAVPLARGMLLTDTFKAAGRSAMILDSLPRPTEATEPRTTSTSAAEASRNQVSRPR